MIVRTEYNTDEHIYMQGRNHYDLTLSTSNTSVNLVNNSVNDKGDASYITITLKDGRQMSVNQLGGYIIMPNGNKVLID
jgi:hypothetical protein